MFSSGAFLSLFTLLPKPLVVSRRFMSFSELELHNIRGFTVNLTDPAGMGDRSLMGVEDPSIIRATLLLNLMIIGVDAEVATS